MADARVTALTPASAPKPAAGARANDARAAQAAFFQAALGQATTPVTALKPVTSVAPTIPTPATRPTDRMQFDASATPAMRALRPGSLVDIKV